MSARLLSLVWYGGGCGSRDAAFTELGRRNDGFDAAAVYVVDQARDDELGRQEGVRLDSSDVDRNCTTRIADGFRGEVRFLDAEHRSEDVRIVGKAGDTAVSGMQHDEVQACGCSTFCLGDGPKGSHRLQRCRGVAATNITD